MAEHRIIRNWQVGYDGLNNKLTGEVAMTITGQRIDLHCVPGVIIFRHVGYDGFNKALTGDTSMTVTAKRSDPHHVPCVISIARDGSTNGFVRQRIAFQTKDNNIANTRPEMTPAIRSTDYKEPIAIVVFTQQGDF